VPFIGLRKPPEQNLSSCLKLGDIAPESSFLVKGKENLILFLRHTGCPFAEAALKALSDLANNDSELKCTAIFHGEALISKKWISSFNLSSNLNLVFDEHRDTYGDWGIGYSKITHLFNPKMLVNLIKLALNGITNKDASGTRWQQQAAFLIDDKGKVQWLHFPMHTGDLPNFLTIEK
jgi:hypothetical protein